MWAKAVGLALSTWHGYNHCELICAEPDPLSGGTRLAKYPSLWRPFVENIPETTCFLTWREMYKVDYSGWVAEHRPRELNTLGAEPFVVLVRFAGCVHRVQVTVAFHFVIADHHQLWWELGGVPVLCALGQEHTVFGTCSYVNRCPFMNARAQNLRAPLACKMFFQCNLCCIISKGPLVVHAALVCASYPPQMQTYFSNIWLPWQNATVSQNCLLTPVRIAPHCAAASGPVFR